MELYFHMLGLLPPTQADASRTGPGKGLAAASGPNPFA
jgi:hypothetical protein